MLFDDECISIELRCGDGSLFEQIEYHNYYSVIFDIDFAKAFWGEDLMVRGEDYKWAEAIPKWKYHLQEMVLVKPPIDYIKKFL